MKRISSSHCSNIAVFRVTWMRSFWLEPLDFDVVE